MRHQILILCAGDGVRWNNYLGCPKQLVPIRGIPLLERTVAVCRRFVPDRPTIVAVDERLQLPGLPFLSPARRRWIVETLAGTAEWWAQRTVALLGDVFYSERAIRRILEHPGDLVFFGRRGPSYYSGKRYGEIFALSWRTDVGKEVRRALAHTVAKAEHGGSGKLWDLLKVCREIFGGHWGLWHEIKDETEDFDSPREFRRLKWFYDRFGSPHRWEQDLARMLAFALFAPRALWRHGKSYYREYRMRRSAGQVSHESRAHGPDLSPLLPVAMHD